MMNLSDCAFNLLLGSPQAPLLHQMTVCIRQSLQLQEILQATVAEVRRLLETDYVVVYQFAPDGNTAEDPGYRSVAACYGELGQATIRQATIVVPILQQKQLWGLLVAHHAEPRTVSEAELQLLQLVVDQVAIAIAQSALLSQVQAQVEQGNTINQLVTLLHSGVAKPFEAALEALVEAIGGSGGRLLLLPTQLNPAGELYTCGDQPRYPGCIPGERLEQYDLWQTHTYSEVLAIADLYQDARCLTLANAFQSTQIRSLLILPLQQAQQTIGYLTLFRNQRTIERLWVDMFHLDEKQKRSQQAVALRPEQQTQQAQGWTEADLQLVQAIKSHVVAAFSHIHGQHVYGQHLQEQHIHGQRQVEVFHTIVEQPPQKRVTDITARKQADVQLRDQEQFFRTVYEGVEQIIAIIDVLKDGDFRYVGWNPTAEKLASIPSAAIVGKTPEAIFGEANGAAVRQNYQRCVSAGTSVRYEEHLPFQEQDIWWLTTVNPLKDDRGNINRLVLTATTITERKQAEAALQQKAQQEQLLNQLANQIRSSLDLDEVLKTAVDSIQALLNVDRCTFAWYRPHAQPPTWEWVYETKPPEFPTLLGLYPSDILGATTERLQNLEVIRDDDTAASSDPQWQRTLRSFELKSHLSIPLQANTGDIGVLSCSHQRTVRPWKNGEVALLTAVANQLAIALNQAELYKQSRLAAETAQAKAEQLAHTLHALQQTQAKLVQTEKMSSLGQLVAGVAHEINNPVNFISGNLTHATAYSHALLNLLQLYQHHYPQPAPAIQAEAEAIDLDFLQEDLPKLLTSMKVGAERIQTIVLALRNFSRMDEAEVKAVNIHDGIDSTLMILQNRLKTTAGYPEIQVLKHYGNLPLIECYAGQLNQVFMNILSNAIDALDEYNSRRSLRDQHQKPATVTIQTELAVDRSQETASPPHGIHIRISDNGPGMTEAVQQRLFEPFFTTKPIGKGTGLGLSISYQVVVDKHGGRLSCLSAFGKGAEFLIELPLVTKS